MTIPFYPGGLGQPVAGPFPVADGMDAQLRLNRDSATVVQHAHGEYYEDASRGNTWTISTAKTGVSPVTSVGIIATAANNPIVGLYNPTSNINCHITRAVLIVVTGTMVTGGFAWGVIPSPTGITSTGVSGRSNNTFASGGHKAYAFDGSAALTGGAAPAVFRAFGAGVAGATSAGEVATFEETENDLVVGPGCYAGLYAAVGATGLNVVASLSWSEIPT